jgi:hypothetical protein
MAQGQFQTATEEFDDTMKKVAPPDKLKEIWESVTKSVGPFKKQKAVRADRLGKYDLRFVTCEFKKADLDARVVFDAKGFSRRHTAAAHSAGRCLCRAGFQPTGPSHHYSVQRYNWFPAKLSTVFACFSPVDLAVTISMLCRITLQPLFASGLMCLLLCAARAGSAQPPKKQSATRFELRIVANEVDDRDAIETAEKYFSEPSKGPDRDTQLDRLAEVGLPPPAPKPRDGNAFATPLGRFTYAWVALSPGETRGLGLTMDGTDITTLMMKMVVGSRLARNTLRCGSGYWRDRDGRLIWDPSFLLFSRDSAHHPTEYFLLLRDPEQRKLITGQYLREAKCGLNYRMLPVVNLAFSVEGGRLLRDLTSRNQPFGMKGEMHRHLAVILNDEIVATPPIQRPLGCELQMGHPFEGVVQSRFTSEEAATIVNSLSRIIPQGK